jgi:hypothetical protein
MDGLIFVNNRKMRFPVKAFLEIGDFENPEAERFKAGRVITTDSHR